MQLNIVFQSYTLVRFSRNVGFPNREIIRTMQGLVVCTIQILTFFFSAVNMQRILTPRDQCFTNTIRNIFLKRQKLVCITMLCKNVVIFTSLLSQYNC